MLLAKISETKLPLNVGLLVAAYHIYVDLKLKANGERKNKLSN